MNIESNQDWSVSIAEDIDWMAIEGSDSGNGDDGDDGDGDDGNTSNYLYIGILFVLICLCSSSLLGVIMATRK